MGRKITLKPNEKIIVENTVISNSGNSECQINVEDNFTILRKRNVMSVKSEKTLFQKLYVIIQLMHNDGNNQMLHQERYWKLSQDILDSDPSIYDIIDEINTHVFDQNYDKALNSANKLIDHEIGLLDSFIPPTAPINTRAQVGIAI